MSVEATTIDAICSITLLQSTSTTVIQKTTTLGPKPDNVPDGSIWIATFLGVITIPSTFGCLFLIFFLKKKSKIT